MPFLAPGDTVPTTRRITLTGTTNSAPTANAGGPYSGVRNVAIALSGSGTDTDGGALSYAWTIRNASNAVVASFNTQSPSFSTATAGTYSATLVVTDDLGAATTSAAATITVANSAPSISSFTASSPATAATAAPDYAFGATATDANGDQLTYTWEYKAQAAATWTSLGSVQQASGVAAASSGSLAVPAGTYDARVTVSDGFTSTVSASTFVVPNKRPIIVMGTPSISGSSTPAPVSVQVTGTTANDPNGAADALSYQWSIQGTSGPAARTLASASARSASNAAPAAASLAAHTGPHACATWAGSESGRPQMRQRPMEAAEEEPAPAPSGSTQRTGRSSGSSDSTLL